MPEPSGWGGKREGAGRPPGEQPPMETVTVRLTREQLAWLSAQPDSFSVTLRRLVQRAMDGEAHPTGTHVGRANAESGVDR